MVLRADEVGWNLSHIAWKATTAQRNVVGLKPRIVEDLALDPKQANRELGIGLRPILALLDDRYQGYPSAL
jgi:hypothetical protein